jgi:hypothetical protein
MIPKRLIQTGKTSRLPVKLKAAVANLKLLNPDFEYLFFDDQGVERFMRQEFPEYCEVFESFPFRIQRYDFFRYLAVYRLGGFYFDLDVFLCSGLGDLLSASCVFPFEDLNMNCYLRSDYGMDWHIGNYAFGAEVSHPFLKVIIQNCVRAQREPGWAEPMMKGTTRLLRDDYWVLNTTGPGLISRTLAENRELAGCVKLLFPEDVCDAQTWHHFGDLGVHLMDGTWRKPRGFLLNRLLLFWEVRKMESFSRESAKLGKTRQLQGPGIENASGTTRSDVLQMEEGI